MHTTRAGCQWEIEAVAQAVREKQLGGGKCDVVLGQAQNWLGIQFCTHVHVMLQMDAAFGKTSASRAVQPQGRIIACGRRRIQRVAGSCEQPFVAQRALGQRRVGAGVTIDEHDVPQIRELPSHRRELRPQGGFHHENPRTTVVQHVEVILRA